MYDNKKIGTKNFLAFIAGNDTWPSPTDVLESWEANSLLLSSGKSTNGLRKAQLGALFAIKSHWTVSEKPATIVMPTGTGKTEVMIAAVISECCKKTCVIVPSDLLRIQTVKRFCSLRIFRDLKLIDDKLLNPIVGCLCQTPKDIDELKALLNCNVIITTMALLTSKYFSREYLDLINNTCDTLIIDEAHHIKAKSWSYIKSTLSSCRCLQFTATPFRNDGKKVDGKIIYDFPLSMAQEAGYFTRINFYPVIEFDDEKKDFAIAKKAVELLDSDISKGFPHLLLVRASTQDRAKSLFQNIYNQYYSRLSPVLIISSIPESERRASIKKLNNEKSRIVVCVDMFSEGIDIPKLKICAIHDKYKSLPITIQFIGRFARSASNLGDASIVANIADDDIQECLDDLYSQNSDWNKVIKNMSESKIQSEIKFQNFTRNFTGTEKIPIDQIRPKFSTYIYKSSEKWHWDNWTRIFDQEHCHYYVNTQEKILIVTELLISNVDWTLSRNINDSSWNLFILYWIEEKGIFFIHATDKSRVDKFAKAIFEKYERYYGEPIFRSLYGIQKLMYSTVGLKTSLYEHRIRYKMFAGIDVSDGISNAARNDTTKSNFFGTGYENGKRITLGCSHKGIIWSRTTETIDCWKKWCDDLIVKVLDDSINTEEIFKNALIPKVIYERPKLLPYCIDFTKDLDDFLFENITYTVESQGIEEKVNYIDIKLGENDDTSDITFSIGNEQHSEVFSLQINQNNFSILHKNGPRFFLNRPKKAQEQLLTYLRRSPPTIWFVDGSSLEGNIYTSSNYNDNSLKKFSNIQVWNWDGVDICVESQTSNKISNSIQYKVISELKLSGKYCLIFDDDSSGEVADIVAIQEDTATHNFTVELYHCKYSSDKKAGARVNDLYEVCGQAQKCVKWTRDAKAMLSHLIKREALRKSSKQTSRIEVGDDNLLLILNKKLRFYTVKYNVYIVQPGVDSKKLTQEMHTLLHCAESYLMETRDIPLSLICS